MGAFKGLNISVTQLNLGEYNEMIGSDFHFLTFVCYTCYRNMLQTNEERWSDW